MKDEIEELRRALSRANTKIGRLETKNRKLEEEIAKLKVKRISSPSKRLRTSKEYKEFRKTILTRDGNKCTKCGSTEKLEMHHIKEVCNFPELAMDSNNVTTLCSKCHKLTENYLCIKGGKK